MKTNSSIIKWVLRDAPVSANVFRSIIVLAGCTGIGLLFYLLGLSEANIITIYILGILLISAITNKWLYGGFSSVAGVLLFNSLFADPLFTLLVYDPQYTITIVIMLLASLATSYVMNLLRRELSKEILVTRRSEILLETSKSLQSADSPESFNAVAISQLSHLLGRTVLLYPAEDGHLSAPLGTDDKELLASLDALAEEAKLSTWAFSPESKDTLIARQKNGGQILFFKLHNRETVYAVVCTFLPQGQEIAPFEENIIFAMLDEIALAIDKYHLHMSNERIALEASEERLRSTLLRAISHDLRTPLTGIRGNADILLKSGREMDDSTRERLYTDIRDDSRWLIDLVENLLFVTRLESGSMPVRLDAEILQDILGEALRLISKRDENNAIRVHFPDELLIVDADARLLVQVVLNLLDNALKHSPARSPITLSAYEEGGSVVVEVADEGPGIPEGEKEKVFEMFYTANNQSGDRRRGLGLGLSLCQAIVQAHGGAMFIRDNQPTGTIAGFTLQFKEVPEV